MLAPLVVIPQVVVLLAAQALALVAQALAQVTHLRLRIHLKLQVLAGHVAATGGRRL